VSYMDSYLGESALIETVPDLPSLDVKNLPQQMLPGMGTELISLPGGIVMSKRALLLLAAGIAIIWMYKRKR